MLNVTPALQINSADPAADPSDNIFAQAGGVPLSCPVGVLAQDVALAAASSGVAVTFPIGVATSIFVFVAAVTTTDLVVNAKGQAFSIPANMGMFFFGLTSAQVTLTSVLGGSIQCVVGG